MVNMLCAIARLHGCSVSSKYLIKPCFQKQTLLPSLGRKYKDQAISHRFMQVNIYQLVFLVTLKEPGVLIRVES